MEPPGGRDSRFMGYTNNILHEQASEIYGNPNLGRPSTSIQQLSPRHTMVSGGCGGRALKAGDMCYDDRGMPTTQGLGMDPCVNDISEDTYNSLQSKKSPPNNGKKTKGRVKIKMEYIENKLRRYTTFSKRKTGIMKKMITSRVFGLRSGHLRQNCRIVARRGRSSSPVLAEYPKM
ncbi:hypothetical protein AMK59_1261 [Oryctes borbonicus]|uniref:MADS-box domain-containing protein n=1 Tax=Oryctes borbonicus TaxID=1629725 RepID=A0A0T6BJ91_9SCAR|nr:hypothetical protein AMK59_1261 [Oryctes borbonicus]